MGLRRSRSSSLRELLGPQGARGAQSPHPRSFPRSSGTRSDAYHDDRGRRDPVPVAHYRKIGFYDDEDGVTDRVSSGRAHPATTAVTDDEDVPYTTRTVPVHPT